METPKIASEWLLIRVGNGEIRGTRNPSWHLPQGTKGKIRAFFADAVPLPCFLSVHFCVRIFFLPVHTSFLPVGPSRDKKTNLREPLKLVSEWLHAPHGKWGNSGNSKSILALTQGAKGKIRAFFVDAVSIPYILSV